MHLSDKYFITISNDGKFASQDEPAGYNNSTPTSTLTQFLRAAKFRSNLSSEAEQHTPLDSTQDRKASVLISKYYSLLLFTTPQRFCLPSLSWPVGYFLEGSRCHVSFQKSGKSWRSWLNDESQPQIVGNDKWQQQERLEEKQNSDFNY